MSLSTAVQPNLVDVQSRLRDVVQLADELHLQSTEEELNHFKVVIDETFATLGDQLSSQVDLLFALSNQISSSRLFLSLGFDSHKEWLASLDGLVGNMISLGPKRIKAHMAAAVTFYVAWGPESLNLAFHDVVANLPLASVPEFAKKATIKISSNAIQKLNGFAKNDPFDAFTQALIWKTAVHYRAQLPSNDPSYRQAVTIASGELYSIESHLQQWCCDNAEPGATNKGWSSHKEYNASAVPKLAARNTAIQRRLRDRAAASTYFQELAEEILNIYQDAGFTFTLDLYTLTFTFFPFIRQSGQLTAGESSSATTDPALPALASNQESESQLVIQSQAQSQLQSQSFNVGFAQVNCQCPSHDARQACRLVLLLRPRTDLALIWGEISSRWLVLNDCCYRCLASISSAVGFMSRNLDLIKLKSYFVNVVAAYNASGVSGVESLMTHRFLHVMFRKDNKPSTDELTKGVKRFPKLEPLLPSNVNLDSMLEYLFGDDWVASNHDYHEEVGTVVIEPLPGRDLETCDISSVLEHPSMEYLMLPLDRLGLYHDVFGECLTLRDLCEQEATMYLYHQKPDNNKSNYGWNRLQYYSIGQVLARVDPSHYVASVGLRPDALASPHLISWPYYVRYATGLEKSEFYHLDINPKRSIESGEFLSCVQSSISLSNENEDCCVWLVNGFHKNFEAWYEHVVDENLLSNDKYGCCRVSAKTYGLQEQQMFGNWEPVPCRQGSMRFSKPEIIHGSSGSGGKASMMPGIQTTNLTTSRLNYLPWMARVDMISGEIEYGHHQHYSLEDLRKDVLDSRVPQWTLGNVTGKKYTVVDEMVVNLSTSAPTAFGRAITCEGKWTDPEAIEVLELLLGSDGVDGIKRTIQQQRLIHVKWAVERFLKLRQVEKKEYGEKSFFGIIERGEDPEFEAVLHADTLITSAQEFVETI